MMKPYLIRYECPICKSHNITFQSKSKYYKRSALFLAIIFPFGLLFYGLTKEKDIDLIVLLGFLMCFVPSVTGLVFGLYYFIRALRTAETCYKCNYCKNRHTSGDLPQIPVEGKTLLNDIRKMKRETH